MDVNKMKLYHATPAVNGVSIDTMGLQPKLSYAQSNESCRIRQPAIYGFLTVQDARNFADDNNSLYENCIIYEFSPPENAVVVVDPEYDGTSMVVITDKPIKGIIKECLK